MIASKEYVIKRLVSLFTIAKKKYSQNFLIDYQVVKKSIDNLNPEINTVLEIGPGLGALSEEILSRGYSLYGFEIDDVMANHLQETFKNKNFTLIKGDFLKQNLNNFSSTPISIISNVPYNITTPLIEKIILEELNIDTFIFMLQKEAMLRICAKKGSKDYSPLSIFLTYLGEFHVIEQVKRDKFFPVPNVDSTIGKIKFKNNRDYVYEKKLYKVLTSSFKMRRKTLYNNLSSIVSKDKLVDILAQNNISLTTRAEQLELQDFINLTNSIYN